jgi:carboxymethylenebutenolidase
VAEWVKLTASDGAELSAYVARPADEPKGGLVVVQEIFGVNDHIRAVTDEWAAEGYLCIAPAIFDRIEKDVFLNYDEAGWAKAGPLYGKLDFAKSLLDVEAAVAWLRTQTDKKVGVIGFCYGGTMAWVTSCRSKIDAAVGYYGGGIPGLVSETPRNPIMLHFGGADDYLPAEAIAKIQLAHPEVPVFLYPGAGHAFNRKPDPSHYVADAADLAKRRSVLFFEEFLAAK